MAYFAPESPAGLPRNRWPLSIGISGRFGPEYAITNIAEGTDNDLAARAWFSVGYLVRDKSPENSIADYGEAIRLKPDFSLAYYNRGVSMAALGLTAEARKDFETTLELAQNAGDTDLQAKAEQALRDLDTAGDSGFLVR